MIKEFKMKVKSVTLLFENCESISYDFPNIAFLKIGGCKENFDNWNNSITKIKTIKSFEIIIKADATVSASNLFNIEQRHLNRAILCDITRLIVVYDNNIEETFYVHWPRKATNHHPFQKYSITEKNNIYICSSMKEKKLMKQSLIDMHANK